MLLTEYDEKKQRQKDKRDWIEEGERIGQARGEAIGEARGQAWGRKIGENRYADLTKRLISANRYSDLERAASDPEYREKLYQEYGL